MLTYNRILAFLGLSAAALSSGAYAEGLVEFTQLHNGLAFQSKAPTYKAVRSKTEWTELLKSGSGAVKDVDFNRNMALVASPGTKPSGGYDVVFTAVYELQDRLEAYVLNVQLGEGCTAVAVATHPTTVVLIPASNKPVRFSVQTAVRDCTTSAEFND